MAAASRISFNAPIELKVKEHKVEMIEREYGVNEGFRKEDNVKVTITHKREAFIKMLIKKCGPPLIQTIFKNHPERYIFTRERIKQQNPDRSIRNPPILPFTFFNYADDVYLNITCNLQQAGGNFYIRHRVRPKVVNLKIDTCGEMAFEEMLTRQPYFYSNDINIRKLSSFVESNKSMCEKLVSKCANEIHFLVDFSLIYPENIISTVAIICPDCGSFVETMLWSNVVELLKKEIYYNIKNKELVPQDTTLTQFVVQLPPRGVRPDVATCSFVEGLMGVTTIKGEKDGLTHSIYVRNRLHYFCNEFSQLNIALHSGKVEKDLHPTINEMMAQFGIQ